jgi:phosphoglycolate phosphatase-like HAD superfamily hydrolase
MKTLFAWDLHGVLEKGNIYAVQEICNTVLKEFGKSRRISIDEVIEWYGSSWYQYYRNLCPESPDEEIREMIEWDHRMGKGFTKKFMKPMDHAPEVLKKIKKTGNSNVVITNTRPENISRYLEDIDIINFLDDFIGVPKEKETGDFSIVIHKGNALKDYAKERGFPKVVMIGDKETDVQAGKIAGAVTFRFINKDLLSDEKINDIKEETEADYVITDLREVLKVTGP